MERKTSPWCLFNLFLKVPLIHDPCIHTYLQTGMDLQILNSCVYILKQGIGIFLHRILWRMWEKRRLHGGDWFYPRC